MKDYIIVGLGIAGIAMSEELRAAGRDFLVFDKGPDESSTRVAGGIYNPVVLKRLKLAWKADEQLPMASSFYNSLQERLGVPFHKQATVVRRFASQEEVNDWFLATDKSGLSAHLDTKVIRNENPNLDAPFGFGKVNGAGQVDTGLMMDAYRALLREEGRLVPDQFDTSKLEVHEGHVAYQGHSARKIIYCTGYGMARNCFFKYLPMRGNKGEYLQVRLPGLAENKVIKGGIFLIPEGNDLYTVGATYNREALDREPTEDARTYLLKKLNTLTTVEAEVVGQVAGIRPTVPDRRPLLGRHPEHKAMYLLNGFGSRGLMIAPYAVHHLMRLMEDNIPLPPEMDLQRFSRKWFKPSG